MQRECNHEDCGCRQPCGCRQVRDPDTGMLFPLRCLEHEEEAEAVRIQPRTYLKGFDGWDDGLPHGLAARLNTGTKRQETP